VHDRFLYVLLSRLHLNEQKTGLLNEAQKRSACYEQVTYIRKTLLHNYAKMNNNQLCALCNAMTDRLIVWSPKITHSPTSLPTYVIQSQIKWILVWLQTVSSPEVALATCHSCLLVFSSTVNHIRFSRLQPQQHFKGLWNSIQSSSKPRKLVSLHRSKYDTWPTWEEAKLEDQLQTVSIMKWMTQFPIGLRNVHIVEMFIL